MPPRFTPIFLSLLVLFGVTAPLSGVPPATPRVYHIDLSAPASPPRRGHLDLGGSRPSSPGGSISVNSFYLERDGHPFVPVVGEFHYARFPAAGWEESLRKMKAGGITVVATYVFWNLHERTEGTFDWSGDLDLRRFIATAGRVGLDAIVRIGPFAHGEMRNGGLPDWLYGRDFEVRSNDPGYLAQVDRLYAAIGAQLHGLLYRDGGPVIGFQLENEFQHSAAPWEINYPGAPVLRTIAERDAGVTHGGVSVSAAENRHSAYGRDHMANLKLIAQRHGLVAPLYTATGWGNASIVPLGSLPVTAAYPYPFWTPTAKPSPFYLFKDLHAAPDYAPVSFDPTAYPSIPAELGAGIQPIYARRPFVPEESLEPLVIRVLGSGSNGVGYYMYHGGATPVFDRFYNEDASGVPKINYDYQSPIGQYGQTRTSYHTLRLLHHFLASYGARLAPLPAVLPPTNAALTPADTDTLRFAARAASGRGFLFLQNFQDHATTHDLADLRLEIADGSGRPIAIPRTDTFTLAQNACAILPVNLDLAGALLRSATVQPLTVIRDATDRPRFVFFSIPGFPPELIFSRGTIAAPQDCTVESLADGETRVLGRAGEVFSFTVDGAPVLVVPRETALGAVAAPDGHLLFSDATLLPSAAGTTVLSPGVTDVIVHVYPALARPPALLSPDATVAEAPALALGLSAFRIGFSPVHYAAEVRRLTARKFAVRLPALPAAAHELFMRVNYVGDTGMAFVDGHLIDDHFYFGRPWDISLRRFADRLADRELIFVFQPIRRDATYLKDIPAAFSPAFADGEQDHFEFRGVEFTPEYRAELQFR